jgi:hypothetical protein
VIIPLLLKQDNEHVVLKYNNVRDQLHLPKENEEEEEVEKIDAVLKWH